MILNLEKIKKLEKKYQNDPIALDALRIMVIHVAQGPDVMGLDQVAVATLNDLGCIKETSTPQQLNS